jgi:hypothetical protein
VVAVRECGEMARHGWPFMGELGLVVDAVQGWGWGVGELAIGAEPVQVRRSAVANEERVRRCCPLTLAGVASRSRSGRGVARVHARGEGALRRCGHFEQTQR